MTEKLAFEEIFRDRAAVYWKKNIVAEPAIGVNRSRDDFFANAAFPGDQNRRRSRSDLADQTGDVLHGPAAAERPLRAEPSIDFPAQQLVLPGELTVIHQMLHFAQHVFKNKRLEQVVLGAETHSFDRGIDGCVRRHQNDQRLRRDLTNVAQHGDAVRPRHRQIGEHQIEVILVNERDPCFAVRGSVNFKALAVQ